MSGLEFGLRKDARGLRTAVLSGLPLYHVDRARDESPPSEIPNCSPKSRMSAGLAQSWLEENCSPTLVTVKQGRKSRRDTECKELSSKPINLRFGWAWTTFMKMRAAGPE
jgi:hypothetical protein